MWRSLASEEVGRYGNIHHLSFSVYLNMNKLKTSFKGSPASSHKPPAPEIPAESDLMATYEEKKPGASAELDLQLVSDDARAQFANILGHVGKKDIVIQPDLLSLLDHVTPVTFLKK